VVETLSRCDFSLAQLLSATALLATLQHDGVCKEPVMGKPTAALNLRINPEVKQAFDGYLGASGQSQSLAVERLIRAFIDNWKKQLLPDEWQRAVRNEMTREEYRAICRRRVTAPRENPSIPCAPGNDIPTDGSAA
jgi:hypothetical protein